jgi:hypothetical protein
LLPGFADATSDNAVYIPASLSSSLVKSPPNLARPAMESRVRRQGSQYATTRLLPPDSAGFLCSNRGFHQLSCWVLNWMQDLHQRDDFQNEPGFRYWRKWRENQETGLKADWLAWKQ